MSAKRVRLGIVSAMWLALGATVASATEPPAAPAFSWLANGAQTGSAADRLAEAKQAIRDARALSANATWVCSPAGFGKRSRCERG